MPRNWSDTVLTVGPDGTVSANFTGVVHATGLNMDAGLGPANAVQWLDVNGAMVAELLASENTARRSIAFTRAKAVGGAGTADYQLDANSDGPSRAYVSVTDDVNGNQVADILRSDGKSSFLRLTGAPDYAQVRIGFDFLQFNGSDASNLKAVAHGLNRVPKWVGCFARNPANARITIQEVAAPDVNNFYVEGFQTQGTAVTLAQSFYWLAIG